MNKTTIILSVLLHGGVAVAVLGAARSGPLRKTFSVQMTDEKKKAPKPPPPKPQVAKPQPPKPKVAAPVEAPKAAAAPKAVEAAPKLTFEPVLTGIEMSNDDSPGGVVIPVRAPAAAAAAGAKVASFEPEARRRRIQHELGPGPQLDDKCHDEPSKPEPVFKTEIEYTHAARAEGIEGKLKLKLTVGADGSVLSVEVLSSVSPELDAAAVAAVRQWRFRPAMACGKPVAGGTYILARRFELGD